MSTPLTPAEEEKWLADLRDAADAATKQRDAIASAAVVTTPGQPGYRGEYSCSDCCSMSHCETHNKDEGTYPFDEAVAAAVLPHPFQRPE